MTATPSAHRPTRALVPDQVLEVGSPIARATYQLMTGQPVVRLVCEPPARPAMAAAAARRLLMGDEGRVTFVANSAPAAKGLAVKVRNRLGNYADRDIIGVHDPVEGLSGPRHQRGVFRSSWIRVVSGPGDSPTGAAERAHLIVVGFDDRPWRGARSQPCWDDAVDFRGFTQFPHRGNYGVQVLLLSDQPVWERVLPRLVMPAQALYEPRGDRPWGPIPIDVLLAGSGT